MSRNMTTNHIQSIFPQLVLQQIHNTLVARQLLPKGPSNFELIFHFFGYADDTPELRALRIKQANLVGPAGYNRGHRARAARDPPARRNGIVDLDGPRSSRAAGQPDHRKPDPQVLDRLSAFDGPVRTRWKTCSCGSRFLGSRTAT